MNLRALIANTNSTACRVNKGIIHIVAHLEDDAEGVANTLRGGLRNAMSISKVLTHYTNDVNFLRYLGDTEDEAFPPVEDGSKFVDIPTSVDEPGLVGPDGSFYNETDGSFYNSTDGSFYYPWNGSFNNATDGSFYNSTDGSFNYPWNGSFYNSTDGSFYNATDGSFYYPWDLSYYYPWDGSFYNSTDGSFFNATDGSFNYPWNLSFYYPWNGSFYNSTDGSFYNSTDGSFYYPWNGSFYYPWDGSFFNATDGSFYNATDGSFYYPWDGTFYYPWEVSAAPSDAPSDMPSDMPSAMPSILEEEDDDGAGALFLIAAVGVPLMAALLAGGVLVQKNKRTVATARSLTPEWMMIGTGDAPTSFHEGLYHYTRDGTRYLSTRCEHCYETRRNMFYTDDYLATIGEENEYYNDAAYLAANSHDLGCKHSLMNVHNCSSATCEHCNPGQQQRPVFLPSNKYVAEFEVEGAYDRDMFADSYNLRPYHHGPNEAEV